MLADKSFSIVESIVEEEKTDKYCISFEFHFKKTFARLKESNMAHTHTI